MDVTYIKLFVDYLDAIEPLGDAERGRLFTALLEYVKLGEVPQLSGNERFLFPMMKAQIDRDIAAMDEKSEKRSECGKLGGRPKKQTEAKKAFAFSESKKSKDKEEDKEEDKDNITKESVKRKAAAHFSPPSREQIEAYCLEAGISIDIDHFIDYYKSNGWHINKQKMDDWKSTVRNWERRDRKYQRNSNKAHSAPSSFDTDEFYRTALLNSYGDCPEILEALNDS